MKFFLNESNFNSPPPFHMMKIDNDVYLNVPQLQFIVNDPTHMLKLGLNSKSPMYLIGHSQGTRKKPPKRNRQIKSKWWMPSYLYDGSHYPVILAGSGKDLCINGRNTP